MVKSLYILMSYPVNWDLGKIMRDFIQNFYDELGPERFQEGFLHDYDGKSLRMYKTGDVDVDWFCYMGVSTKRDGKRTYAGKFGEGFKVASLAAYRNFGLGIQMSSKDWIFDVIEEETVIDGVKKKCLAYDIRPREANGITMLVLSNVSEKAHNIFLEEITNFFYYGNPKIGQLVASGSEGAVYGLPKPGSPGMIFAGYQCRRTMSNYPFIIECPSYDSESDDRDREDFYSSDALMCTFKVAEGLPPGEALKFLEQIECFWSSDRKADFFPMTGIIDHLVHKVFWYDNLRKYFQDKYGEKLLSACFFKTSRNDKRLAKSWFSQWPLKNNYRVVRDTFHCLGIRSIPEICRENGGFSVTRKPNEEEKEYIQYLHMVVTTEFLDILSYENGFPPCDVITNEKAHVLGYCCVTATTRRKNDHTGLFIKNNISQIYIKRKSLCVDGFPEALSTYLHELLHQYGSDSDRNFHHALELMACRIMQTADKMRGYEEGWRRLANPGC